MQIFAAVLFYSVFSLLLVALGLYIGTTVYRFLQETNKHQKP